MTDLLLLPYPRQIIFHHQPVALATDQVIALNGPTPADLLFTAQRLQQAVRTYAGLNWPIVAGTSLPANRVGARLNVIPGAMAHPQGYRLDITPMGIDIVAAAPAGIFYGANTLIQIIQQRGSTLPALTIIDQPDFPQRGVMLDISRDKVPTLPTLLALIDHLAGWKINQLQLYTEHTFAYQNHPEVWAQADPLTAEDIFTLDAYCRRRFIELVPNQNTFGHMRRWLIHPRYRPLAECPHGCDTGAEGWGYFAEPFTLCPADPGSLALVGSLLDELLPHFTARQVNIGGDETVELGLGRSKEAVARRGKGPVYLDFLLKIYREVKSRGRVMQFWGDIIMAYPELVRQIPRDAIALEWGYEADHPFDEHAAKFAASGIPFYVCPGTASWNSIGGRTQTALQNLQNAAVNGLKHGAVGYLITDWGDNGHWQPLPVSYPGFVYGAALAWGVNANRTQDVVGWLNRFVFADETGLLGRVAYELGDAYLTPGADRLHNTSVLFHLLQTPPAAIPAIPGLTAAGLQKTLNQLTALGGEIARARPACPDADLQKREFAWAADMLSYACRRGLWAIQSSQTRPTTQDLLIRYRDIWLARNRPGGLADSLALLQQLED